VILSDLHLGDGGRGDDFAPNAPLVMAALDRHYRRERFRVVLNGDIEELMRFSLPRIQERWRGFYERLGRFPPGAVIKLIGNHDADLRFPGFPAPRFPVREAVRFNYAGDDVFIFHGHQASPVLKKMHRPSRWLLRFLARPLGIPNYSVAHDSRRRFRIEERAYRFARNRGLIAVIGHTHRPLFESLAKADELRFRLEQLCRLYSEQLSAERELTAVEISRCRLDLQEREKECKSAGALYHDGPLVPCLFNSGCSIGKSGITTIEIHSGDIALVHWFDRRHDPSHFPRGESLPERLADTDFYRVVLKQEPLRYLFARIHLLGDELADRRVDRTAADCRLAPVPENG
jgi:UDP-2,3-diacylglucosamine pyrophosphatase LpxH